ncbi:polysaccharide deacetylase family protein [Streptomyces sp. bgisy060]|uniref:polysaccharide deacetylase family protein n=1 Tax=Streptomyces sp. bgisy060 TaxID=3413775 RepID=UPI003EB7548D
MKPTDRRGALRAGAAAALVGALSTACGTEPRPTPAARAPADAAQSPAAPDPAARGPAPAPRRFPGQPDEITHGPRDRPRVALTFHGQGDPALATGLLARAERAGARLTVLAVGSWLDEHPEMARRILDGGHELGNHTQRHVDVNAMTEAEALAEIEACATRLRRLTGSPGTWFRPSRAQHAAPAVLRAARRAGYPHVLSYDVDSLDFTSPGPAAIVRNTTGPVRAGSVVSLHFGYPDTAAALPLLLADLDRRGLSAVTTTELFS